MNIRPLNGARAPHDQWDAAVARCRLPISLQQSSADAAALSLGHRALRVPYATPIWGAWREISHPSISMYVSDHSSASDLPPPPPRRSTLIGECFLHLAKRMLLTVPQEPQQRQQARLVVRDRHDRGVRWVGRSWIIASTHGRARRFRCDDGVTTPSLSSCRWTPIRRVKNRSCERFPRQHHGADHQSPPATPTTIPDAAKSCRRSRLPGDRHRVRSSSAARLAETP